MESHCQTISSKYSKHLSVDDASRFVQREPLSDLTGNAHYHTVASASHFHEDEGYQHPVDRPLYPNPSSLSCSPTPPTPNKLEIRRQHVRRQRISRHVRNPIEDSVQYQEYRKRKIEKKKSKKEQDDIWPDVLESAFLDALLLVPRMGRGKFRYDGKDHGRNEMISKWLWIAYLWSLGPGECPDQSMKRFRKKISSHIQVLRKFLHEQDPVYKMLFPPQTAGAQNDWENNPILITLAQCRLPIDEEGSVISMHNMANAPNRLIPATFWLLVASNDPHATRGHSPSEGDLYKRKVVAHRYTSLEAQRRQENLESLPNWWRKFPTLARLRDAGELNCNIVHMDVSLGLIYGPAISNTELVTKFEMTLPGREMEHGQWRTIISLSKPSSLHVPESDPLLEAEIFPASVLFSNDFETRVKVAFPIQSWMYTFCRLAKIQKDSQNLRDEITTLGSHCAGPSLSTADLIDQISMYQEVQCSPGLGLPFCRRAIILWTFREEKLGDEGFTTWKLLDTAPNPQRGISASPHTGHTLVPGMHKSFHAWDDSHGGIHAGVNPPSMHSQESMGMLSPYMTSSTHSMISSPQPEFQSHTESLIHSPFVPHDFNSFPGPYFDLPPHEPTPGMSFASTSQSLSHTPLNTHDTTLHLDEQYLTSNIIGINLGAYSNAAEILSQGWHTSQPGSFVTNPAWQDFALHDSAWDVSAEDFDGLGHGNVDLAGGWASAAAYEGGSWLLGKGLQGTESGMRMDWVHVEHVGEQVVDGQLLSEAACDRGEEDEEDDDGGESSSGNGSSPEDQVYESQPRSPVREDELERLPRWKGKEVCHDGGPGDQNTSSSWGSGKATMGGGSSRRDGSQDRDINYDEGDESYGATA